MSNLIIRFAQPSDLEEIINLCEEHAEYEQANYDRTDKLEKMKRALFESPTPPLHCLMATDVDSHVLGYATYMRQFSTWDATPYIYMDCLYLRPVFRSQGIGVKLMDRIQEEAKVLGCSLIQWQTPEFNTRAIKFYKRIGATSKSKERFFWEF